MYRRITATTAVPLVIMALTTPSASAAQDADAASVPQAVQRWFDTKAPSIAPDVVLPMDDDWMAHFRDGARVSFGPPARQFTLLLPTYDLETRSVSGPTDLAAVLDPTDIYCGTISVVGSTVRGTVCAEYKDGKADFFVGGTEDLLPEVTDLPADGYVDEPLVGMFSVDRKAGTVDAIDVAAKNAIGTRPMQAAVLTTKIARYLAEEKAIRRVSGPTAGGMDLNPTKAEQKERDALAAEGLALPDDLAWHEGANLTMLRTEREARGFEQPDGSPTASASAPAVSPAGSATSASDAPDPTAASASSTASAAPLAVGSAVAALLVGAGIVVAISRRRRSRRRASV